MRDDDERGFEDFVSDEQPALLRLAVLLTGDRGHAEDLVQTALITTYRHWPRISAAGPPTAYVRRVLVTSHISWRRRLMTTEQVVATLPDRADPSAGAPDPDEALSAALRTLPPRMRAAVVLRFYADLTERQAAKVMGCSASAVNTHTTRGLARLRAVLAAPAVSEATAEERS